MKKSPARKTAKTYRNKSSVTKVTAAFLKKWPLPFPDESADKSARGSALIIGGSRGLAGAPILSTFACLRAGAGKLATATPPALVDHVSAVLFESRVIGFNQVTNLIQSKDAILIGPGMNGVAVVKALVKSIFRDMSKRKPESTLILDAEALKVLNPKFKLPAALRGRVIMTPHAGEMAHILGLDKSEVESAMAEHALSFAHKSGVITVLKGRATFIATPEGKLYQNENGNVGLATSGSGDVLAGIICGLAARGADPAQAAVWGAYLHAKAGDRLARSVGRLGFLAREVIDEIPGLLQGVLRPRRSTTRSRQPGD